MNWELQNEESIHIFKGTYNALCTIKEKEGEKDRRNEAGREEKRHVHTGWSIHMVLWLVPHSVVF